MDFLAETRQSIWQVLPLGPTGYGDSPYQCFSAFAGNPLLVSLDALAEEGLLSARDLAVSLPEDAVDYGAVIAFKRPLLRKACAAFEKGATASRRDAFLAFCREEASWLDDFALFMALKDAHGGAAWHTWDEALVDRDPEALAAARLAHSEAIHAVQFVPVPVLRAVEGSADGAHARAGSGSWATSRSSWPTTAPTSGPGPISSPWPPTALRPSRRGCPPTTSAPPASSGATRSTGGMRWSAPASPGGSSASARASACSTSCASTTSAASRPTGRSPGARPRR